jgi:hypothetical protein
MSSDQLIDGGPSVTPELPGESRGAIQRSAWFGSVTPDYRERDL